MIYAMTINKLVIIRRYDISKSLKYDAKISV